MKKQILLALLSTILILRLNAHPGMSPYAYCGGNPVIMVDPDGRNYTINIDDETQTITITATYYTTDQDAASAQKAADFWNSQSGEFIYQVTNKNDATDVKNYTINFNMKVVTVGEPSKTDADSKYKHIRPSTALDKSGNIYMVITDEEMNDRADENTNGQTGRNRIWIRDSKKDSPTGPHEMGHSLGLDHNETGLMTPGETNPYRSKKVRMDDINKIIYYPLKGDVNGAAGEGILTPNSSIINLKEYDGKVIRKEKK